MLKTIVSKTTLWQDFSENLGKTITHTKITLLGVPIFNKTHIATSRREGEGKRSIQGFKK